MPDLAQPAAPDVGPSGLIYGSMDLGGGWDDTPLASTDVDAAEQALEAAVRIGITWVDTADIYRNGKSERVLGQVFGRRPDLRRHFRVQSKFGVRIPGYNSGAGLTYYRQDADTVASSVEGSLTRLGTDHLDSLLIHRPSPIIDRRGVARALDRLVDEGTVGAIGVSNMLHHQMAALQAELSHPLRVDQLQLSLEHRDFVEADLSVNSAPTVFPEGTLEYALAHGVQIQAWSPLASGLYDPSRGRDTTPPRGIRPEVAADPAVLATRQEVARQATAADVAPSAIVLAWLIRHPCRIVPVIGSARPDRIAQADGAAGVAAAMTDEDWWALFSAARGRQVR